MAEPIKAPVDLSEFRSQTGPPCSVSVALSRLSDEQRKKILAAFDEPSIAGAMIHLRLKEWSGARLAPATVLRHRRKECSCD